MNGKIMKVSEPHTLCNMHATNEEIKKFDDNSPVLAFDMHIAVSKKAMDKVGVSKVDDIIKEAFNNIYSELKEQMEG